MESKPGQKYPSQNQSQTRHNNHQRTLTAGSPWLLVLLASLVALGPLTIDMYLPALPGMVHDLDTNTSRVQLTISAFLLGFAVFHLVCGPLADRYGRKPVLAAGMGLFILASVGCALADNIDSLIMFRFLQGVGACVGPTLGRAVARDIFGPREAARALAYIAMIMAAGPLMVIDVETDPRSMSRNRSSMSARVSMATPQCPTSPRDHS